MAPTTAVRAHAQANYSKRFRTAYGPHRLRAEAPHHTSSTKSPEQPTDHGRAAESPLTVKSVADMIDLNSPSPSRLRRFVQHPLRVQMFNAYRIATLSTCHDTSTRGCAQTEAEPLPKRLRPKRLSSGNRPNHGSLRNNRSLNSPHPHSYRKSRSLQSRHTRHCTSQPLPTSFSLPVSHFHHLSLRLTQTQRKKRRTERCNEPCSVQYHIHGPNQEHFVATPNTLAEFLTHLSLNNDYRDNAFPLITFYHDSISTSKTEDVPK